MFDKIKDAISGQSEKLDASDLAANAGVGEYAKYLEGVSFPASKDEVLAALNKNGAPEALQSHVESLTSDHFDNARQVFTTLLNR